ncbi:PREDICTED: uncharacterized protein LOC107102975 [Cyprinodon variegatus]|uniref:uncharacterized protein LOC107102975 n=1 Tax=Cyprinodon variegatus TaxID=28743 RepID=UPI000742C678|nr:PREDICTED: uncharacterized protein LOC107102975 [Cyprinodon variegatus]
MAPPAEDRYCCRFQPNAFDPSRCSSCLRPNHMHLSGTAVENASELDNLHEQAEGDNKSDEDEDDDDPASSAVTTCGSSDDFSEGWNFEWNLERSPSPDWEPENREAADIQPSFLNQWKDLQRNRSLSPQRPPAGQPEMTRLHPSIPRDTESSWMEERRGRDMSRRASESRSGREKESGYFSPDVGMQQMEDDTKRTYRYYERGHPLPSNYIPEPKACVPYRNVSLGLPSQRRNPETYMQATWRSESPQRYTYHSNFRRGTDSVKNSPSRHSSLSPDRYRMPAASVGPQRGRSLSRSQAQSRSSLKDSFQIQSNGPSRRTSGGSSPSHSRWSMASHSASSHRRTDSVLLQSPEYEDQKMYSRESRSPSQASNKHSLDSEKLYRNLESISRLCFSAERQNSYEVSLESPPSRTHVNSLGNILSYNSREVSASGKAYSLPSHGSLREPDHRLSQSQGSWQGSPHSLLNLPSSNSSPSSRWDGAGSDNLVGSPTHVAVLDSDKANDGVEAWQGSSHNLLSRPQSQASSSARQGAESQGASPLYFVDTINANQGDGSGQEVSQSLLSRPPSQGSLPGWSVDSPVCESPSLGVVTDTVDPIIKVSSDRSNSSVRRGMDALLLPEQKKTIVDPEEVGMTIDDYIMLADIPKIQVESEEDFTGIRRRNESPSPCRNQRQRSYRHQDETDDYSPRLKLDERRRGRERGRDRREKCPDLESGRSSRRQSAGSLHAQTSDQNGRQRSLKIRERSHPERLQTQMVPVEGLDVQAGPTRQVDQALVCPW